MPNDTEDKKLLSSIIKQVSLNSVNWEIVAVDLGLPTRSAANMRWQRFKKTLPQFDPANGNGPTFLPSTPKKRASPTKNNQKSPKKQKRSKASAESDDDEIDMPNLDDKDQDDVKQEQLLPETPQRSLPARGAKAKAPIKEEDGSEEEEDEGIVSGDAEAGSGYGSDQA